jgi:hypothetical protein
MAPVINFFLLMNQALATCLNCVFAHRDCVAAEPVLTDDNRIIPQACEGCRKEQTQCTHSMSVPDFSEALERLAPFMRHTANSKSFLLLRSFCHFI